MGLRTYDRNVSLGTALIANDDYTNVRYINIKGASSVIEDIDFNTLKILHDIAMSKQGETWDDFVANEWSRYSEHEDSHVQAGRMPTKSVNPDEHT